MKALIIESSRIYDTFVPTMEDRIDTAIKHGADHITYLFIPDYRKLTGMSPELASKLLGDYRHNTAEEALEWHKDNPRIDAMEVQTELYPDYKKWWDWSVLHFPEIGIENVDTLQYYRALVAAPVYLAYKDRFDFTILCPFKFVYNIYVHRLVNLAGFTNYFPEPMTEKDCYDGHI